MLDQIIADRRRHIALNKQAFPLDLLEHTPFFDRTCESLSEHLQNKQQTGIIAEFKRRSPSKGIIKAGAQVLDITSAYVRAGAAALSVLTEPDYFMGSDADLKTARSITRCPILRKDFIVDDYQVLETKAIGADAMLLIAACLSNAEIKRLHELARSLGLEVLFEIHSEEELDKIPGNDVIVGVNNRNLKTMEVSLDTSFALAQRLGNSHLLVSESGLQSHQELVALKEAGYSGFLMGEAFMRHDHPGQALQQLNDAFIQHYQHAH